MIKELSSYHVPQELGLSWEELQLSPDGIDWEIRKKIIESLSAFLSTHTQNFMGFQATQFEDYRKLAEYLKVSINNIGDSFSSPADDPFSPEAAPPDGYFQVNSKYIERAVLDYYAELWSAKYPHLTKKDTHDREEWLESYWGYVLSMGSTEGNLLALRNARDYLNGTRLQFDKGAAENFMADIEDEIIRFVETAHRFIDYQSPSLRLQSSGTSKNNYTPVLFYTGTAHYSIKKITKILQIKTFKDIGEELYPGESPLSDSNEGQWPALVPTHSDGTVDLDALSILVDFFSAKGFPVMINFNYGTTWTGAYDNVEKACDRLIPILKKNGMYERDVEWEGIKQKRKGFWFHVDGALGASYVPYLKMQPEKYSFRFPDFDFKLDIQSIVTSGHKWMGAPWPCGIFMTKNSYLITNDVPEYVGSLDSTLAGSRNGFSPILYWDYLSQRSYKDLAEEAGNAQELADYAYKGLNILFPGQVKRAPGALAVRFPRPSPQLVKKYSLSSVKNRSHVFVMKNIRQEQIDNLLYDLEMEIKTNGKKSIDESIDFNEILPQGW